MIFIGMIVSAPLSGWLSDTLQKRRLPILIGASIGLLISLILLFFTIPNTLALMSLFLLFGFFTGVQVLGYPLIIENNSPQVTTLVISVISISIQCDEQQYHDRRL